MDNEKLKTGILVGGVAIILVAMGVLIWTMFRPPVTDGPEPPQPSMQQ